MLCGAHGADVCADAGIYIPLIMQQIDQKGGINLVGAAIGDGCWGNSVGMCGPKNSSDRISVEFYYGHGMYPEVCVWVAACTVLMSCSRCTSRSLLRVATSRARA